MSKPPKATFKDLALIPEEVRAEIIDGEIVEKAAPTFEHAEAHLCLGAKLNVAFHGKGGRGRTGGWWIVIEPEIELEEHEIYLSDLAAWRRDRLAEKPKGRPVRVRPDWVCEVLSPSNAHNDLVKKFRVYHRSGVTHYWIVDPENRSLVVYRREDAGYLAVLTACADETVRAEPFEALEIRLAEIFGVEAED